MRGEAVLAQLFKPMMLQSVETRDAEVETSWDSRASQSIHEDSPDEVIHGVYHSFEDSRAVGVRRKLLLLPGHLLKCSHEE